MFRVRPLNLTRAALVCGLLVAVASNAPGQRSSTNGNFLKSQEEGWFWYEQEPEPPEEPPPLKLPLPKPASPSVIKIEKPKDPKVDPMSVEWFQKEYPNILNSAIDNPSDENVKLYRYATRVMLDKASNFTRTFQRQSLLDPLLDESTRSPFSTAMRGSYQRWSSEQKTKATEAISKKAGLWVFLDEKCPFCAQQYPIVARTARERGFEVSYITPDGSRPPWVMGSAQVLKDEGQSRYLRISVRPAVALVVPPEKITVLTQGLLSQDLLEERILHAGDAAGLITGTARKNAFPEERGILTTEDIKDLGDRMKQDPKALIPEAQERIQRRY